MSVSSRAQYSSSTQESAKGSYASARGVHLELGAYRGEEQNLDSRPRSTVVEIVSARLWRWKRSDGLEPGS